MEFSNEVGLLPTRNFQTGIFENAHKISGDVVADRYNVRGATKTKGCFGCPLACGRVTKVKNPEFRGQGEGPEYETLGSLGAVCGVDNIDAVIKANYICNEMGIDTISAGATLACAMELYEKGYLPEEVGMKLNFGNAKAVVELLKKTALRQDFGATLAEGSYRVAEKYQRMFQEPMPDGPGKGYVVHLGKMLPEYYQARGWNDSGVPEREKLNMLGLED